MPKINVTRPFSLKRTGSAEIRHFAVGAYEITEAELGHWFVQACIRDGYAVLAAEAPAEVPADVVPEASNGPDPAAKKAKK
jgi:hypothetical protein